MTDDSSSFLTYVATFESSEFRGSKAHTVVRGGRLDAAHHMKAHPRCASHRNQRCSCDELHPACPSSPSYAPCLSQFPIDSRWQHSPEEEGCWLVMHVTLCAVEECAVPSTRPERAGSYIDSHTDAVNLEPRLDR